MSELTLLFRQMPDFALISSFEEIEHKRSREIEVTQTILFEKNLENGLLTEEFFQVNLFNGWM